jgi:hypothetical protein
MNNTDKTVEELAHEAVILSLIPEEKLETPCENKDVSCNRRWIESLSDCA